MSLASKRIGSIAAGNHDGHLGVLFDAIFARAEKTEIGFGWKLRVDGDEWSQETVTLAELAFAERTLSTGGRKTTYLELDPLKSMEHCVALIVAHLHIACAMRLPEAFKRANGFTVTDLKDLVSAYEVKVPKEDGGESTNS